MKFNLHENEILTEFLHSLSLLPSTSVARFYEDNFHPILSDLSSLSKDGTPINNCYNHRNGIMAIILNNQCYITPQHLIREYILIRAGLSLNDFEVPFSDTIYKFEKTQDMLKWQGLIQMRDATFASF